MSFYEINIALPAERDNPGYLQVRDENGKVFFGPIVVYGASDKTTANKFNNSDRDTLKPYGNTPFGIYYVVGLVPTPEGTSLGDARSRNGLLSYGRDGVIKMTPIGGDALTAAEGPAHRTGIWIHGGDLSADGRMRPTHGCIRVAPRDMAALISAISRAMDAGNSFTCPVTEGYVNVGSSLPLSPTCEDEEYDPPPDKKFVDTLAELNRRRSIKEQEDRRRSETEKTAAAKRAAQVLEDLRLQKERESRELTKELERRIEETRKEQEIKQQEDRNKKNKENQKRKEEQEIYDRIARNRNEELRHQEQERQRREEDFRRARDREEQDRRRREDQTRQEMQDRVRAQAEADRLRQGRRP